MLEEERRHDVGEVVVVREVDVEVPEARDEEATGPVHHLSGILRRPDLLHPEDPAFIHHHRPAGHRPLHGIHHGDVLDDQVRRGLRRGAGGGRQPSEGGGRLYAVALQNAAAVINYDTATDNPDDPDVGTTASDRYADLNSPGIPAEVVSVPPNKILRPDLQVDSVDVNTRWRTFWYIQEDSDL